MINRKLTIFNYFAVQKSIEHLLLKKRDIGRMVSGKLISAGGGLERSGNIDKFGSAIENGQTTIVCIRDFPMFVLHLNIVSYTVAGYQNMMNLGTCTRYDNIYVHRISVLCLPAHQVYLHVHVKA